MFLSKVCFSDFREMKRLTPSDSHTIVGDKYIHDTKTNIHFVTGPAATTHV